MASPCKTCPRNATKHPGLIMKTSTVHQNSAQVKAAAAEKRATKDAKDAARTASIHHATEFESTALDMRTLSMPPLNLTLPPTSTHIIQARFLRCIVTQRPKRSQMRVSMYILCLIVCH